MTIPQERLRNFSIIAHIDHGKSTLADRILEVTHTIDPRQMTSQVLDSMDLEREKGITIKARAVRLEYIAADGLAYGLNLIDTPGHVDFTYEVSRSLQACEGAVLVVDAAQGIEAQTLANVHLAMRQNLTIIPVVNKIDLPSAQPDVVIEELENVLAIPREEVILASAKEGIGIVEVLEAIVARVPAPRGDPKAPLRALVFDSHYDAYKGVVVYVRLEEGRLRTHDALRFMASGADALPLEIGVFRPQLVPMTELVAGEVGYIATGLKSVRDAQVGDTVTTAARPATAPLPGYQMARTTRSCATPWRSSTSTTRASRSSRRARSRSASGSGAASSACSTWRSSRSASSASSGSTSSRRRPRWSTESRSSRARGRSRWTTPRSCRVPATSRRSRSPG